MNRKHVIICLCVLGVFLCAHAENKELLLDDFKDQEAFGKRWKIFSAPRKAVMNWTEQD